MSIPASEDYQGADAIFFPKKAAFPATGYLPDSFLYFCFLRPASDECVYANTYKMKAYFARAIAILLQTEECRQDGIPAVIGATDVNNASVTREKESFHKTAC